MFVLNVKSVCSWAALGVGVKGREEIFCTQDLMNVVATIAIDFKKVLYISSFTQYFLKTHGKGGKITPLAQNQ